MSRTFTRRGALAVLGTGLAAVTGAARRPTRCAAITGSTRASCGDAVALSGPDAVAVGDGDPRFVAENVTRDRVRVDTGSWALYRRGEGWERVAGGDGGGRLTLAPGERTAWVLLVANDAGAGGSVATVTSTQTRYVGPVTLVPGEHAFVARGARDGRRVESVARFAVE